MNKVLVLGAGKIGALISGLLAESGAYQVQLADVDETAAAGVARAHGLQTIQAVRLDATDAAALRSHLQAHPVQAVVSSLPYHCNALVAAAARDSGIHYFDLTEDVEVTRRVSALAQGAAAAFVPQCGLAPGFISIAGGELIRHFDSLRSVRLRVGALPQHPHNVLKYSLTWSTEGLINEYGNPCEAIVDGARWKCGHWRAWRKSRSTVRCTRPSIPRAVWVRWRRASAAAARAWITRPSATRALRADATADERPEAQSGSRYAQAHSRERRAADTAGRRDRVRRGHRHAERRAARRKLRQQDLSADHRRRLWSAIQVSTASGLCAVLDLVLTHPQRRTGLVTQESFRLPDILANRFGRHLAAGGSKDISADVVVSGAPGRQRSRAG
jgi:saccharopine dehydrogenase-like NADP-dependent oxidoreductase